MDLLRLKACFSSVILLMILAAGAGVAFAQTQTSKSQEISDVDGQPVLLQHLPNYERVRASAVFTTDKAVLQSTVQKRSILEVLEFPFGTEAVTALYPEGRLLIVEYTNPQSSSEADTKIQQFIAEKPQAGVVYKRIGNYNAFVLDAPDAVAANGLLDQVKYEKTVQWLGEDPHILKKLERYMVTTSRDVMIATVLVIVLGLAASVLAGIAAGFIFFRIRDQKRAHRTAFSDAGGLTRLNLDGLSEDL